MKNENDNIVADTRALAARYDLHLTEEIRFNEMGLDFLVGFATDTAGRRWVLRIPRREEVRSKIEQEARILDFVKRRLPVEVPDWQVCEPDLVAYPMLSDPMALNFDAVTCDVTWNIDKNADNYIVSLAEVLAALHASPVEEAVAVGIPHSSPQEVRESIRKDLETVKREIGVGLEMEKRCRRWLDTDKLWPDFCVLTHGDLYAGHVSASPADARVSGVIDWTEAEVGDPSNDFSGHLAAFSLESLRRLVLAYEETGGRTWPAMVEQITERHAVASPLRYGVFATLAGNAGHIEAARRQLGVT